MAAPYNSFTDYPNGVTSFGMPLFGGGGKVASTGPGWDSAYGRTWFVDVYRGADGNSGQSPSAAFGTMARAFESLASGDVINFRGRIAEQLVTPENVFDVTINGLGNRPRHADAAPAGGNIAAAQWAGTGGTAAVATLRVLQQGWRFQNFLFTAVDANAACVEIVRNAASGDLERDASHASFYGVRFSGAGMGIRCGVAGVYTEIPYNVEVGDCQFDNMTTAIGGALRANQWYIHDSVFMTNTNHILVPASGCTIKDNSFSSGATASVSLAGSGAGLNQVSWNNLGGLYESPVYVVGAATDNWYGNATEDGVVSVDPA